MRNLMLILDGMEQFEQRMNDELTRERYAGGRIRIHDAGDFFSDEYLITWLRIIRAADPGITFYTYTKQVSMFKRLVTPETKPDNFHFVFSLGGREDFLIEQSDRHADVFPDEEAVTADNYSSQSASDLLAIYGPPRVGIVTNNISAVKKKQGRSTFSALQLAQDARRRRPPVRVAGAARP